MQNPVRVLIAGAGAIGSFYGAVLQRAGVDVSVICNSEFGLIKDNGISIESPLFGKILFRPNQVMRSACEYTGGVPDFVILCVKVVPSIHRIELIRDAVGPGTTIVLIQNGVEIEEELASAFPDNEIVSVLARVMVSRISPGNVKHIALGELILGNFPQDVLKSARQLAKLFEAGGIDCILTPTVVTSRWEKCVWNAVFNTVSVLASGADTESILTAPGGEEFVRQAMTEMCDVAAATGNVLPDDTVDRYVENTRRLPPYKTSMTLDFEQNRPMEVDAILGNAVKAGLRESVNMPILNTLYALMQITMTSRRP